MPKPNTGSQPTPKKEDSPFANEESTKDYYFNEHGLMVMTAAYHLKRGFCCGNACLHCPYDHINVTE